MNFIIENVSRSSGRLGQLIINDKLHFKTPLLIQTTRSGSIPYLSRDTFDRVTKDPQCLELSLATILKMVEAVGHLNEGDNAYNLSSYCGYKGYPNVLLLRDPCDRVPTGYHNAKDIVPIFTKHGKELITQQRFMEIVETLKPDIYQGLCDVDTNIDSSKKRIMKSLDRTEAFMSYCCEKQKSCKKLNKSVMFAPIVGGYNLPARSKSIKQMADKLDAIGGYIFEGLHDYGCSPMEVKTIELLKVIEHCTKEMDANKPRLAPGAYTPSMILELIRLGIDMFDTSYAYLATFNFKALTFDYNLSTTTPSSNAANCPSTPCLDLKDERYNDDFRPLLANCTCLTCRQHTRSYLQHLHNTNELLGPILLMIHNIHHYMEFFKTIHQCIADDNLLDLIKLIKYQNTDADQELNYRLNDNYTNAKDNENGNNSNRNSNKKKANNNNSNESSQT